MSFKCSAGGHDGLRWASLEQRLQRRASSSSHGCGIMQQLRPSRRRSVLTVVLPSIVPAPAALQALRDWRRQEGKLQGCS